ncbi:hypothetical protein [Alloyangia pacifica]
MSLLSVSKLTTQVRTPQGWRTELAGAIAALDLDDYAFAKTGAGHA